MRRQRAQELRAAVDRLPLGTRQNMLKGLEKNLIIVGADGNVRGGRCPMMAASVGSSKVTGKPFARAWDAYAGVKCMSRPATRHELQALRGMLVSSIEAEVEPPVDLAKAISSFSSSEAPSVPEAPATTYVPAAPATPYFPIAPSAPMETSTVEEPPVMDLAAAIAAHRASRERTEAAERAKAKPRKLSRPDHVVDTGERDRTEELERRHGWAWLRPFRRLDEFERAVHHLEEAERAGLAAYKEASEREAAGRPPRNEGDRDKQPVGTPAGGY